MHQPGAVDQRRGVRTRSDDIARLIEQLAGVLLRISQESGWRDRRHLQIRIRRLQHKLAATFGERNGWRLSAAGFSPYLLARRGISERMAHSADGWPRAVADHPFYYRATNRRAAAVAVHLYRTDERAICSWAAAHRLRVAFPAGFPSWWLPGETKLCIYEPLLETGVRGHG